MSVNTCSCTCEIPKCEFNEVVIEDVRTFWLILKVRIRVLMAEVRSYGMLYVYRGPYKHSSTNMCVHLRGNWHLLVVKRWSWQNYWPVAAGSPHMKMQQEKKLRCDAQKKKKKKTVKQQDWQGAERFSWCQCSNRAVCTFGLWVQPPCPHHHLCNPLKNYVILKPYLAVPVIKIAKK